MSQLTQRLQREAPTYTRQRFVLSGQKQRDMFMDRMMSRICRMDEQRMSNQDADMPATMLLRYRHRMNLANKPMRYSMSDYDALERLQQRIDDQQIEFDGTSGTESDTRVLEDATGNDDTATTRGREAQHTNVKRAADRSNRRNSSTKQQFKRRFSNATEFFRAK